MDVGLTDTGTFGPELRAAERRPTKAASTMRAAGTQPIDVIVLDVSETGLRIVTPIDLAIGQEISIGLAGAGSTRAFVAWKHDGQYGCRFDRPLGSEGAALAFSAAPIVRLGATAEPSGDFLRDLSADHRHFWLPADSIIALIVAAAALIGLACWLLP